jgi:hypothetical protein
MINGRIGVGKNNTGTQIMVQTVHFKNSNINNLNSSDDSTAGFHDHIPEIENPYNNKLIDYKVNGKPTSNGATSPPQDRETADLATTDNLHSNSPTTSNN